MEFIFVLYNTESVELAVYNLNIEFRLRVVIYANIFLSSVSKITDVNFYQLNYARKKYFLYRNLNRSIIWHLPGHITT